MPFNHRIFRVSLGVLMALWLPMVCCCHTQAAATAHHQHQQTTSLALGTAADNLQPTCPSQSKQATGAAAITAQSTQLDHCTCQMSWNTRIQPTQDALVIQHQINTFAFSPALYQQNGEVLPADTTQSPTFNPSNSFGRGSLRACNVLLLI